MAAAQCPLRLDCRTGSGSHEALAEQARHGPTLSQANGVRPSVGPLGNGLLPRLPGRLGLAANRECTHGHRAVQVKTNAVLKEDLVVQLTGGVSGLAGEAEDVLIHLQGRAAQLALAAGLPEIPPGQETVWLAGLLLAATYLMAPPGGLWGLADFFTAPLHSMKKRHFCVDKVRIGRQLGEGSFGTVFEGFVASDVEGGEEEHVILKRVKARVEAAVEMRDVELFMNFRLQRTAPKACAEFLGTLEVPASDAHGKLHGGLWLVWRYQGERTLAHFMKQKGFPANLAPYLLPDLDMSGDGSSKEEMMQREGVMVRAVMRQLLGCLRDLHQTGVVHRDVKPSNVVVAEEGAAASLRLIDLGACVDLRSGHNYVPHETVMDPKYAAPEKFVMPPNTTPPLPPDPICSVLSPFVWAVNTPDRFDLYSAGIILMQLCVKQLRTDVGLESFNQELSRRGHDLDRWREKGRLPESEFALLDADDGAGWDLARALLQPRGDAELSVWPGLGRSRPSAAAALRFRFFHSKMFERVPARRAAAAPAAVERHAEPRAKQVRKRLGVEEVPAVEQPGWSRTPGLGLTPNLAAVPVHVAWTVGSALAAAGDHVGQGMAVAGEHLGHTVAAAHSLLPLGAVASDDESVAELATAAPPSSPWPRPAPSSHWPRADPQTAPSKQAGSSSSSPWPQLALSSTWPRNAKLDSSEKGAGRQSVAAPTESPPWARSPVLLHWARAAGLEEPPERTTGRTPLQASGSAGAKGLKAKSQQQPMGEAESLGVEEVAAAAGRHMVTILESAPQVALLTGSILAGYEGYQAVEASVRAAHEMGRSAVTGPSTTLAAGAVVLGALLLAAVSETPPEDAAATSRGVPAGGAAGSAPPARAAAEGERQGKRVGSSAARKAPRDVVPPGLLEAVKEMEAQLALLESSIYGQKSFSTEQDELIQRVESLLLHPLSCPLPRRGQPATS